MGPTNNTLALFNRIYKIDPIFVFESSSAKRSQTILGQEES